MGENRPKKRASTSGEGYRRSKPVRRKRRRPAEYDNSFISLISELSIVQWFVRKYASDDTKAEYDSTYRHEFEEYEKRIEKKHDEEMKKLNLKLQKSHKKNRSYKVKGGHVDGVNISLPTYVAGYFKNIWVRGALMALGVFFIAYLIFQVYMNFYTNIKYETVGIATYSEIIETTGVSIRSERLIESNLSGEAVNAIDNGEKVSKGQTVINVFKSSKAASAYSRIEEIENEINELTVMATASEDSADEVANLERQTGEKLQTLLKLVNGGNVNGVSEIKSEITYLLNKRQVAMRLVEDYQDRIDELNKEKDSLLASYSELPNEVHAPTSGYFVNSTDGYEKLLDFSVIENLTATSLDEIMKKDAAADEDCVGKLITEFKWYLACPVSAKEAEDSLSEKSVYTLLLPYSETGSMKATLIKLVKDESDSVLAIFECNSLAAELCSVRSQPVRIQIKSYTGFSVKKSALHVYTEAVSATDANGKPINKDIEKRYPCVYVLVGNQIVRKRINVTYNGNKNVICSTSTAGGNYLQLYDEVITEGKGLHVGKIINK